MLGFFFVGAIYAYDICRKWSSAQSTADVPVTETMKTAARQEILDKASLKMGGNDRYIIRVGDVLSVQVYGEGDCQLTAARIY